MGKKENVPRKVTETKVIHEIPYSDLKQIGEMLAQAPYPFYAFLLGSDTDEWLAEYVGDNWQNLHYMTGEQCMLLSIFPPKEADKETMAYWKTKLGDKLAEFPLGKPNPSWSYKLAAEMKIPYEKLPCLFLTDALDAKNGYILPIPKWTADDLTNLFEAVFQTIGLMDPEDANRLVMLRQRFKTFPVVKIRLYLEGHWTEFVNISTLKSIVEILVAGILGALKKQLGVS